MVARGLAPVAPGMLAGVAAHRKHLNEGEELILDLHPHWIFLAPSITTLVIGVIVGLWIIFGTHGNVKTFLGPVVGVGVLIALVWFGVRYAKWITTQFAVTNHRIMSMTGIFTKKGMQIPLERINTVEYSRTLIERMLGAGDLWIESASDGGRQEFEDIRRPDDVQREIYVQIRANSGRGVTPGTATTPPAAAVDVPVGSVPDQLAKLDELRRSGALSEAEFQAQKARLLGT